MSSPLSNLKRTSKAPLPGYMRKLNLPPYPIQEQKDTDKLLEEVATDIATVRVSYLELPCKTNVSLPNITPPSPVSSTPSQRTPTKTPVPAPSDKELLSLMMARISGMEAKMRSQSKELTEKDRKMAQLEQKLRIMEQQNAEVDCPEETARLLKVQCVTLQKQIQEMEDFLYDYGLIWVGETDPKDEVLKCGSRASKKNRLSVWKPDQSVTSATSKLDYDVIIRNINELNILAGDGITQVQHTKDGARLKYPEPVQLTLYKNGILMFNGPFRPLTEPSARSCLCDIMEGYFPSELQTRYPDGVPIKVTDKRNVYYQVNQNKIFPGTGRALDGQENNNTTVDINSQPDVTDLVEGNHCRKVVNELPEAPLSVDRFLDKLPSSVIRNGKVVDIRKSVGSLLKDDANPNEHCELCIVETLAYTEMKQRLESASRTSDENPGNISTLRIKSETGDYTYVLKMKYEETIATLRGYLDDQRKNTTNSAYQILSTFPRKVLSDPTATIEDCGLIPSATLHLEPFK